MRRGRPRARGGRGWGGGARGAGGERSPEAPGRRHLLHWSRGRSPRCCRFCCRPRHWARGSRWLLGEPACQPLGPCGPRRENELLSGPATCGEGWDAEGQETPLCSSAAAGASSVSTVSALFSPPLPPDSPPLLTSAEPGSRLFVRDKGGPRPPWKEGLGSPSFVSWGCRPLRLKKKK